MVENECAAQKKIKLDDGYKYANPIARQKNILSVNPQSVIGAP